MTIERNENNSHNMKKLSPLSMNIGVTIFRNQNNMLIMLTHPYFEMGDVLFIVNYGF